MLERRQSPPLPPDRLIDFLAMDRDFAGCLDADADLVAANVHNGYDDLVPDHNAFVTLSRKDKHFRLLPLIADRLVVLIFCKYTQDLSE
jgi:hypothetical protein